MAVILLVALLLLATAVALALRGASASRLRSRELIADVGAYGFRRADGAPRQKLESPSALSALALRAGEHFEQKLGREQAREIRVLLNSAGLYRTSVARYLGYRALAVAGAPLCVGLLAVGGGNVGARLVVATLALAGLGWIAPPFLVRRRARLRIEQIDREVPELVDLLVTTVEAGIGFAAALQTSARRVRGPLGEELRLTLREQSMGLAMDDALQNLLERAKESVSMRAFVQAIVQGETLGVSIGRILRDLAVDMRKRRRQSAEERAQKAPVKLLFPLVFLIMPAMIVVVLGPAAYAIVHSLGG
jgi:tight adherence protein C